MPLLNTARMMADGGGGNASLIKSVNNIAETNARAAEDANNWSYKAQQEAMAFNAAMMAQANAFSAQMQREQQAYNSQMQDKANAYNSAMWQNTSNYNAQEQEAARAYNSAEAQKNREWQEYMSSTAYQRAVKDLKAAGLNPILAAFNGGANMGAGAVGTSGAASIGSISSANASSGLVGGQSASVGGFQGQMANTSNTLALLGAGIEALSGLANDAKTVSTYDGLINNLPKAYKSDWLKETWKKISEKGTNWLTNYKINKHIHSR